MNNEPRYLNIEQELYPQIKVHKLISINNQEDEFAVSVHTQLTYDSVSREIDLTNCLAKILAQYYPPTDQFEICIYDDIREEDVLIGYLPSVAPLRLGEQFLEEHVLQLRIKHLHRHLQGKNEKEPDCEQPQDHVAEIKKAKKRTIRDMLIRAEQWRSLQASNPKLSLQQSANLMSITRRTLQEYLNLIRLGEKYQFPFLERLDDRMSELRKFVKEKQDQQQKEGSQILNRFSAAI